MKFLRRFAIAAKSARYFEIHLNKRYLDQLISISQP